MKNGKKLMYLITGVAYTNSLWERLRTKTTLLDDAFSSDVFNGYDDSEKSLIKSIKNIIVFTLILIFWPFVLVLDLTTKWDVPTKKTEKKVTNYRSVKKSKK
jgi:hypothetical protein